MISYLAPTPKELGQLIRGYRRKRAWTQAQLAQQAGLLPKTLSAIEAGTGHVLLANVMRCLSALEVDLYLASRTSVQPRSETPQPQLVEPSTPVVKKASARSTASRRRTATNKALKEPW
jgi:DNA-binding XRE family transcriptional regulator